MSAFPYRRWYAGRQARLAQRHEELVGGDEGPLLLRNGAHGVQVMCQAGGRMCADYQRCARSRSSGESTVALLAPVSTRILAVPLRW